MSETVNEVIQREEVEEKQKSPSVKLKLRKTDSEKKVQFSSETVDNEMMNKKKSKCCCIYEKPRQSLEESDEETTDDECSNCYGHKPKKEPFSHDPV